MSAQPFLIAAAGKIQLGDNLPVIPGNEPDYSELQVMLDNPDKYNTFPKGTFTEELDKAVYGTNEGHLLICGVFYSRITIQMHSNCLREKHGRRKTARKRVYNMGRRL